MRYLPVVLNAYLIELNRLNTDLDILPQKDIIKVLDEPDVPRFPTKPNRRYVWALGVIGSLGIGFVGMLGLWYFQDKPQY